MDSHPDEGCEGETLICSYGNKYIAWESTHEEVCRGSSVDVKRGACTERQRCIPDCCKSKETSSFQPFAPGRGFSPLSSCCIGRLGTGCQSAASNYCKLRVLPYTDKWEASAQHNRPSESIEASTISNFATRYSDSIAGLGYDLLRGNDIQALYL
jgi:hypothetical protein